MASMNSLRLSGGSAATTATLAMKRTFIWRLYGRSRGRQFSHPTSHVSIPCNTSDIPEKFTSNTVENDSRRSAQGSSSTFGQISVLRYLDIAKPLSIIPENGPRLSQNSSGWAEESSRRFDIVVEEFDDRLDRLPAIFLKEDHVRTLTDLDPSPIRRCS